MTCREMFVFRFKWLTVAVFSAAMRFMSVEFIFVMLVFVLRSENSYCGWSSSVGSWPPRQNYFCLVKSFWELIMDTLKLTLPNFTISPNFNFLSIVYEWNYFNKSFWALFFLTTYQAVFDKSTSLSSSKSFSGSNSFSQNILRLLLWQYGLW
jgi:hypothetical protein